MDPSDSGQAAGAPRSRAFLYVPVGGAAAILVAVVLWLTDVVPVGVMTGVVAVAAAAMVAVAWSAAERNPHSWTRAHEDEDDEDDPAAR